MKGILITFLLLILFLIIAGILVINIGLEILGNPIINISIDKPINLSNISVGND